MDSAMQHGACMAKPRCPVIRHALHRSAAIAGDRFVRAWKTKIDLGSQR